MKYLVIASSLLWGHLSVAQGLVMGNSATMNIGSASTLYLGPDASFSGALDNDGEIIGRNMLDFQSNTEVGKLRYFGVGNQQLAGDSLIVDRITLEEGASVVVNTPWAMVTDSLTLTSGSISPSGNHRFFIGKDAVVSGDGHIAGPVYGIVGDGPLVFPTGINGMKNHLQITSATEGTILQVACEVPSVDLLTPSEDMIGISDEVQWRVAVVGQQLAGGRVSLDLSNEQVLDQGTISVDFSGVDLASFAEANVIRANDYEPALIYYSQPDSAYRIVESSEVYDTDEISYGKIRTSTVLSFASEPLLLGLASVPVLTAPTFFVPSAFAPRGAYEENHEFRPYFAGSVIHSVAFSVWDSFNEQVHSFNQQGGNIDLTQTGWDGRLSSGLEAPAGVYYFSVDLSTETGRYTKNGALLLVK